MLDKYKTGIKKIDEQHQKLFDIIEQLKYSVTKKDMIDIMKNLKMYSEYHFKTEEEYFIGLGFKKAESHIRSHNILNNLQNVAKKAPTVAFFPGNYNGQSLELFGLLTDDNYYRAFSIELYQIKK